MRIIKYVVPFLFLISFRFSAFGQVPALDTAQILQQLPQIGDSLGLRDSLANHPEYLQLIADSAQFILGADASVIDSLAESLGVDPELLDSLTETVPEAVAPKPKSDIETTIDYKARDSIFFDLQNQMMYLYGESEIDYGDISLSAERISLDWVTNSIQANYILDTAGKKVGKPIFKEKQDVYETDDIKYNFKSKRALINGVITEQDGAFMHGERVKKNEKDEMFIRGAKYTTCDHAYPHYYIKSSKLKVIPNNKVVSGPFNLYFGEIATPIGFPFGMFPQPKEKASGIIFPSYGEDQNRGFFLRNGGYYFDINDYMDLKLTGDIFTNGSYGLQSVSTYRKRYAFSGNFNLRYNKTNSTQFEDESFSKDFWLNWSHSPQSVGTSRFSASVSAGTSTYSANANNVGYDYQQSVNAQFNSNISYSKTFQGTPFNLSVNARHSQNISTEIVNVTLPELSFNMNRIYPLKNVVSSKNGILSKLGFSYNLVAKSELTNAAVANPSFDVINRNPLDDSVIGFSSDNLATLFDRAKLGARHTIPIATSFNVMKYLTVSPSFNYTEVWYPKELQYTYDAVEEGVRVDTLRQFSRAGWYSSGASVSTRFYGMYNFAGGKVKAIRHVITPSVGFSYSPDFGDPSKGHYSEVQIDEDGNTRTLSKYQGFAYGGPSQGENASLSFSMNHNIEMKVKTKNDSIDEYKKVKIFDNLSMSSGYNFLADSFNLSNINWNARTSLFNNVVSLNMSGTIDPYVYVLDSIGSNDQVYQRRINRLAWDNGDGLGRLTRGNVAIGLNLKPKGSSSKNNQQGQGSGMNPDHINNSDPDNPFLPGMEENQIAGNVNQFISRDPNQYVPFDVPWALNVNYAFNYTKNGFNDPVITQTLNFNGNLSITDKTRIGFNSGYDIKNKKFTVTRLNIGRDLHCWTLNFNWVPFGPRQSYFVEIRVNSQLLKDLKLDKKSRSTYTSF
ncbi:MAG: putative LPS assembly protein LptD [Reichenbachiella sp.]|uniref:putative LPS assembly protein LptD n=1 Tax=Reichenbachiella sp. TaxID=2184521 RepID=UPI0032998810